MDAAGPAPVPSQLPTEIAASIPVHSAPTMGHPAFEKSEAETPPVSSVSPIPAVAPTESLKHESGSQNSHLLVNGKRPHEVYQVSEPHLDFGSKIIGDDLDDLLDNVTHEQTTEVKPL